VATVWTTSWMDQSARLPNALLGDFRESNPHPPPFPQGHGHERTY